MLLMIDNYDSFTYNLVHYFQELGQRVEVYRNDEIGLQDIEQKAPDYIVISPGPCTPDEAGISMRVIEHFASRVPTLGVCLGHQSLAQVYGGNIVRAQRIMHGKVSEIHHRNTGVFSGLPNPFTATRYHSLVVDSNSVPACLEVDAWTCTDDGDIEEIMGLRHREMSLAGVQFHPESVLTESGHELLKNFLELGSAQ